ncbi:MAG: nucleotidyltransferase domain-containing protein [Candidatus Heimdallarchaeota archaeon]|nr:nucleotidyltransferase domain-containing protein [Candidatus Heimdallarchaeota archaeon]
MTSTQEKENTIKEYLATKYNAKVLIIVGSRAVGDFKPQSDWDIYMFTDVEDTHNESFEEFIAAYPEAVKEEDIDLYWYDMDVENYPAKLWRDLRNSKIILDTRDGFGQKLIQKALNLQKKGPEKWTKDFAFGRTIKARRYMKKFEDNLKERNYEELFLRIAWHYSENIINWWFGIRQEFPLRPQQAFPYIKEEDPEFFSELEKIVSDETSYEVKIEAFGKIHKLLFDSKLFKKLIGK